MAAPEIAVAYVSIVPSLQGFQQQLKRDVVGPSADVGKDAGEAMGGGLKGALKTGAAGAALAAGALIAKGLGDAIEQSNITTKLQAQLGGSGKDAAKYGKVAGKLYTSGVTETFQEGADAIKAVMQSGIAPPGATNSQLQKIATKATDVSKVFDQDLGGVTNAVSQLMRTGLAKNSKEAFDLITKGMQSGANKADDLLDTVNEYSVQFKRVGLDGKTAMGLLSQGLKAGARDSDQVADAIGQFGERALAGGKGVDDAYKSIGLNADDVAKRIGKGGSSAEKALGMTLDALRGTKNEQTKLNAAAALFGDPANVMGDALFKLDTATAAASGGFNKAGGSADKLGKTLRSGPGHELEVFKRRVQQGITDAMGKALPYITAAAKAANTYLAPALRTVGSVLKTTGVAVAETFGWFRDAAPWLAPLGIAIGGITLALNAQAIATGLVTGVMTAYSLASKGIALVTSGWAAAQALLNAVMALNPFVLVAIAVVALGAALVVAYQKSETFRSIITGAWAAIQTATKVAWESVIKPAIDAFAATFTWLYNSAIKPAASGIGSALKVMTAVVTSQITGIVALFKSMGKFASWLWKSQISPAFSSIGSKATWLYNVGIRGPINRIIGGFKTMGQRAKALYDSYIKPVFASIGRVAKSLWDHGVKPPFDAMKRGVKAVGAAFNTAKDYISKQWKKLSGIAKAPIKFIVDTVYNRGIVGVWNKVATAFGAPPLKPFKFANGGILPGYTPGRDPHKFYSPTGGALELSGGEAIMRPEVTRALGSGMINRLNGAARSGGVSGVRNAMAFAKGGIYGGATQKFADGGIFGWVKNASSAAWDKVKAGASWLGDTMKSSAIAGMNKLVNPLLDKMSGNAGFYSKMVKGIPKKIISSIFDFSGSADKKLEASGIGGKGTKSALRWARTQNGKKYQWAGNGNPSWDCSGFMSAIESVIRGQKPHRRWATGAFSGSHAPGGWVRGKKSPFMIGITNAGVGHTAGTLNGVNVESRGGDGVIVGSRARGAGSTLFTDQYGFAPARKYDSGGWLQPGATMSVNKTGKPEPILTGSQWSTMATLASRGATGGLQAGDRLVLVTDGGSFEAYVDARADKRIDDELTTPAALGRTL